MPKMQIFQVFDLQFDDPELEKEFHKFFNKNGMEPLFTNEHHAPAIKVPWADARSVVNNNGRFRTVGGIRTETGGAWHMLLKEFTDYMNMSTDNQNYENMLFKILYNARDFKGMMRNIRTLIEEFKAMPDNFTFNMWNVVKYKKVLM